MTEGQWEKSHLTVRRWESEKHKSWDIPVEGFWNHVATEGSLFRVSGKWSACGWSVVQMKHDEEMRPMHGMYGTQDAELEVRCTMKRAELTAFLCLFRRGIRPATVHVDKKGIIDGLWRGEMRCTGPRAKDADLWILIWEEFHRVHQEGVWVEVEHVKAHSTRKCRFSKSSSLKAMRKQMSWHKRERGWTEEIWRR